MRTYIQWNTLKGDSWTRYYFNILPTLLLSYDKNSFSMSPGEDLYHKELTISLDFLWLSFNIYFSWDIHQGLL